MKIPDSIAQTTDLWSILLGWQKRKPLYDKGFRKSRETGILSNFWEDLKLIIS